MTKLQRKGQELNLRARSINDDLTILRAGLESSCLPILRQAVERLRLATKELLALARECSK